VGVSVNDGVGVGVDVSVDVGVSVGVSEGRGVSVGVEVGVGVGGAQDRNGVPATFAPGEKSAPFEPVAVVC
jgi:hypothetical protein